MTTPSRAVTIAAIVAGTVVGVVLLFGALGTFVPPFSFDLRLEPPPDQAPGVSVFEPPGAPPSPPLMNSTEPLLLARGEGMGMNEVVGYRFGERVPPPHWPPVNDPSVPELPPQPLTVRPMLTNADEVARQLTREYPAALGDAGIGGVAHLWIHLDTRGVVDAALVHETSGYEAIDRAAVNIARTMIFDPAMSREGAVTAWMQIPIRFQVVN